MEKLFISKIEKDGETRIACHFTYNKTLLAIIREIPGSAWSRSLNCWHIPYRSETLGILKKLCDGKVEIVTDNRGDSRAASTDKDGKEMSYSSSQCDNRYATGLKIPGRKLVEAYHHMLEIKKYSPATVETYVPMFTGFVAYLENQGKDPEQLEYVQVHDYIRINSSHK